MTSCSFPVCSVSLAVGRVVDWFPRSLARPGGRRRIFENLNRFLYKKKKGTRWTKKRQNDTFNQFLICQIYGRAHETIQSRCRDHTRSAIILNDFRMATPRTRDLTGRHGIEWDFRDERIGSRVRLFAALTDKH